MTVVVVVVVVVTQWCRGAARGHRRPSCELTS